MEDDSVLNICSLTTKLCCQIFIHRIYQKPTCQAKFSDDFDIDVDMWKDIYALPFRCCKDVKIQIFQYKINLNCCMTNSRLYKMRIVDSSLCNLCHSYPETVIHLFCECEVAKHIWFDFISWWDNVMGNKITLSSKHIMFGYIADNLDLDLLLNLCILIVKRVIYICRLKNQRPHLNHFKQILKTNLLAEKNIAVKNNTMHAFMDKWRNIEDVL